MIRKTLITTLLLSISLLANNTKEKIDLSNENSNIKIVNEDILIVEKKSKEDYEKKSNLLTPVVNNDKKKTSKKDDITIDGGVDFNKTAKSVDGVKLNLGTKF